MKDLWKRCDSPMRDFTASQSMVCATPQPKWTQDEYGARIKTVGKGKQWLNLVDNESVSQ
ncbi:hypothetical protein DLR72_06500 [Vibrio paracholerae]|uniref:Uncharacterized protein n=1 Tax=Vibrio paracholerae TaxID=650003 RepID=A0ABD7FX15_9VIBR|nr:hypothetical protein DLR72_06500 [Vibrio paracholerae]